MRIALQLEIDIDPEYWGINNLADLDAVIDTLLRRFHVRANSPHCNLVGQRMSRDNDGVFVPVSFDNKVKKRLY